MFVPFHDASPDHANPGRRHAMRRVQAVLPGHPRVGIAVHDRRSTLARRRLLATLPLVFAFAAAVLTTPQTAHGAIFKCTDAAGDTTYRQTPCPIADASTRMPGEPARASADCRIARNFLAHSATDMQQGGSSHALFDRYGGVDALSPAVLSMSSYVYTFQGNREISAARIVALGLKRCEAGNFGRVDCSVFPASFIDELGGCQAATRTDGDRSRGTGMAYRADDPGAPAAATTADGATGGATGNAMTPASARDDDAWRTAPAPGTVPSAQRAEFDARRAEAQGHACRVALDERIASLGDRMNEANTPRELDRLNERVRELRDDRRGC